MATTKVVDILGRASIILQDSTNVRFPNDELLKFFNDAQKEVVLHRPDANMQNVNNFTCVAGSKQTIPTTGLRLVDVVRNVAGRAITQVDRKILDETLPNWHETTADGTRKIEHFIFDPADPKHFYVYPKATTAFNLEIVYSAAPTDISISNFSSDTTVISLDDVYANAILDYILYRAYQKDSEFAGNAQRSMMHYQGFTNALGVKTQVDAAVTPMPSSPDVNAGRM
tara:strand:+ start:24321 stop:25001 length:681 start_codon:yes stop_codon:yes gene_type:complete